MLGLSSMSTVMVVFSADLPSRRPAGLIAVWTDPFTSSIFGGNTTMTFGEKTFLFSSWRR